MLEDLDETGRPVPLGDGVLPGGLIGSLIRSHVPEGVSLGGLADHSEQVSHWLAGNEAIQ